VSSWGWEIPAGRAEAAETPRQAAEREVLEETGWRPGPMRELATYHPNNGMSDMTFHLFIADSAEHVGAPTDPSESERIEWIPVPVVRDLVRSGEVRDGLSLTALSMALLFELPAQ
jgi:8-oxo-dGTP pyrophosphatase MutT (NUDIX family)